MISAIAEEAGGAEWGACPLSIFLPSPLPVHSRLVVAPLSPGRRTFRLWGHAG